MPLISTAPLTVADVETLLANPTAFRAWLEEKAQGHEFAGICGEPGRCPIYEFLRAQGVEDASVGKYLVTIDDGCSTYHAALGRWAKSFIGAIDCMFGGANLHVLASECLQILAEIEVAA